jgi:hypothetical protein
MYDAKFPGRPAWMLEKQLHAAEKRAAKAEEFLVKTIPRVIKFAKAMDAKLKSNEENAADVKGQCVEIAIAAMEIFNGVDLEKAEIKRRRIEKMLDGPIKKKLVALRRR